MKKSKDLIIFIAVIGICVLIVVSLAIAVYKTVSTKKSKNVLYDTAIQKPKDISKEDLEIINKYNLYESNTYYSTMSLEDKKNITNRIDEIIEQINSRNYSALYSKLNSNFKAYKFPTQVEFEKYASDLIGDTNDFICDYFVAKKNGVKYKLSSQDNKKITITINNIDDNDYDYDIYFDTELVDIEEKNNSIYVSGIIVKCIYKATYQSNTNYVLELENTSNSPVTVSFDTVDTELIINGVMKSIKADENYTDMQIPAKGKVTAEFSFLFGEDIIIDPQYINLICKINNVEYNEQLKVEEDKIVE